MSEWSLKDAQNDFGAVVKAALEGTPQRVVRQGEPVVVVISAADYERLAHIDRTRASSPPNLLLAMPRDGGRFERIKLEPRDVDL